MLFCLAGSCTALMFDDGGRCLENHVELMFLPFGWYVGTSVPVPGYGRAEKTGTIQSKLSGNPLTYGALSESVYPVLMIREE